MLLLSLAACQEPLPQAFDWRIDRTLVPGLNLVPPTAEEGTARRIDALVLSPWPIDTVAVEVCGLVTDVPTRVSEVVCFTEESLVQKVADGVPATWTPPDLTYECEGYTAAPDTAIEDTSPLDTGPRTTDSAGYFYGCGSYAILRVVAHTDEDEGSSSAPLGIVPHPVSGSPPDASAGDPRLELVEGDPVSGGEVRLRFSTAPDWDTTNGYRWYVDDGILEGTGRTGVTGLLDSGRPFSDNTLDIPETYEGDLRVAVVTGSVPQLWQVLTLEVR
jgi:hypothetical protein